MTDPASGAPRWGRRAPMHPHTCWPPVHPPRLAGRSLSRWPWSTTRRRRSRSRRTREVRDRRSEGRRRGSTLPSLCRKFPRGWSTQLCRSSRRVNPPLFFDTPTTSAVHSLVIELLRRKYVLWRCALVCERLRCEPWRPWAPGDGCLDGGRLPAGLEDPRAGGWDIEIGHE